MVIKKIKTPQLLILSVLAIASTASFIQVDKSDKASKQALNEPSPMQIQQSHYGASVSVDGVDMDANIKSALTTDVLGFESQYGDLPGSLRGAPLENNLIADDNGHLIITGDIKYTFDYFLSTINEEELDTILLRMDEYLNHYLQEPALSESKAILAQYMAMKFSLVELQQDMGEQLSLLPKENMRGGQYLQLLRNQLNQRNGLRAEHLDPEVHDIFYADEEAYDEYTYSRLLINSDKSLSSEERIQRLAELQQVLPEDVRQSIQETQIVEVLQAKTEKLLADGGTQQQVRELRKEMFGEEAAQRFDELDRSRAEWKARVDDYLIQRSHILNTKGLAQDELQLQVDSLRESHFDTREQLRVKMIERQQQA